MVALIYPAIKLLTYSLWCYLGLQNFRPPTNDLHGRSLLYGFLRLLMGLFFAIAIWLISSLLISQHRGRSSSERPDIRVGLCASAVDRMVDHGSVNRAGLIFFVRRMSATLARDRNWRLGGIAISRLAGIPLVVVLHGLIPTGRFLC